MFTLEIETGHDATTYYDDIAELLMEVSLRLQDGYSEGNIIDRNGNKVGKFKFESEE